MTRKESITNQLDWMTVLLFFLIVLLGWLNIYAAVYNETDASIFSTTLSSGRQFLFIMGSVVLIIAIMVIDFRFYDTFAFVIYGAVIAVLIFVLLFGREVAGSKSWFELGPFRLQPSEFAKFATALAVSKIIGTSGFRIDNLKSQALLFAVIGVPAVLIILQGDTGTALVFSAFVLVFYREGMSPFLLIIGVLMSFIFFLTMLVQDHMYLYAGIAVLMVIIIILGKKQVRRIGIIVVSGLIFMGTIYSVDYVFNNVLKPHQQNRILTLVQGPEADPQGAGYNVLQSKIAIGSGGFSGKGFLNGTQTKYDYVPEQSTDFIFCTIGEEHGWLGSLVLIVLFVALMLRVIYLSERQKSRFARTYGYCVACILFFHFAVNIGMTIGLFPVVGIPLPFFSHGGSSLWAFTILLFIFLKLDAHRMQVLTH
jgi:rod shape determining protein RodA